MKTTEKYAAFLFALLIPTLFVGCKSKQIETLPSTAETCEVSNPFIGIWKTNSPSSQYTCVVYIFRDDYQWESYVILHDGSIMPEQLVWGTYFCKGSTLFITGRFQIIKAKLDGDVIKVAGPWSIYKLHRVSADDSILKQLLP
jgi:hypothetical protein